MDRDKLFKGVECCANFLCGECPYAEVQHNIYKERCMHQMLDDLNEWIKSTHMRKYTVTFTKQESYDVEAENRYEAENMALEMLNDDEDAFSGGPIHEIEIEGIE